MKFFAPWGFLALLGIPVILFMYLLKQKHKEKEISSLFLWKQALLQSQSHEPWQKLRKNWLMMLQILAVVCIAAALANPFIVGGKKAYSYILALDCSMSMQGKDETPTRFEAAKGRIRELVEQTPPDTEFTLIAMEENPYIALSQSKNKKEVLKQLEQIEVTYGGMDWDRGIALLQAQPNYGEAAARFYTDKILNQDSITVQWELFGKSSENSGITLLSHIQTEDTYQVMVKVKNFGFTEQRKTVTLFCDGKAFDVAEVDLPPETEQDVIFSDVPLESSYFSATISPEDLLPADDLAYDGAKTQASRRVLLITEENVFLEKVLTLLPNIELYKTNVEHMESLQGYDLYIFDGVLPEILPTDGQMMVWNPPENTVFPVGEAMEREGSVKSGIGLEVAPFLEDISFDLGQGRLLQLDWGEEILQWQGESIAVAGEWQGKKTSVFAFDLHDSDLPLKKEFPIFMYHWMGWYFPDSLTEMDSITAGQGIDFQLLPNTQKASVLVPSGKEVQVVPPFPAESFSDTRDVGIYTLKQLQLDGTETERFFAVNPKTQEESDLSVSNTEVDEVTDLAAVQASRSLRNGILFLLLIVLAAEWWVNCREY